ncbi:MAG: hypothetical protein OHK0045_10120 [Raineya sp.]
MTRISYIFVTLCLLAAISCKKKDTPRPELQIPTSYDGTNFASNATTQRNLLSQLAALTAEAQRGRNVANTVSKSALDNLFNAGNPSLANVVTAYFKGRLEGTGGWLDELAKASGNTYTPAPPSGGQGGVFGGYLLDENGLEIEQLIEKGQFGATLYKHATDLIAAENFTEATTDQLLAIFGATPNFSNSGSNNIAADVRDRAMANYAARRSDINDNNSLYLQIKNQFIKLQAAIRAGADYNKERNEALAEIKLLWEKVNAATAINYCHSVIATLSQTNPTDAQKGSALHALGEAIGFIHGFRTIPQAHKKITDAQIDEILQLFNAPQNGTPTCYLFVTDAVNQLPKLSQVINKLKDIYGFSNAEIEAFKINWVNQQGR